MGISRLSTSTVKIGSEKLKTLSDRTTAPADIFKDNSIKHFIDFEGQSFSDSVGSLSFTTSPTMRYSAGVNGNGLSAAIMSGEGAYTDTNNTLSGTGAMSVSLWSYINSASGTHRVPSRQIIWGIGNFGTLTPDNKNIDIEANCYDTTNPAPNGQGVSNQYGIHYWGNGVSFGKKIIYDEWVHIVFSYDGGGTLNSSTCRMWINGKGPYFPNRSFTSTISSSYRMCIGRRYYRDGSTPDLPMNGKVDKIRVFSKALSSAEALVLYNNGVAI